jgi:hypothetical protein
MAKLLSATTIYKMGGSTLFNYPKSPIDRIINPFMIDIIEIDRLIKNGLD